MRRFVQVGFDLFLIGIAMNLVYYTAPAGYQATLERLFGPGGIYAHLATGLGMVMSIFVLLVNKDQTPAKRPRAKHME